ncbi:MAG: hypothetical protein RR342_01100 [Bacilli bacterium]|jgi:hypothetical protein
MEEEKKKYWEIIYDKLCENIKFKFRKMNTVEHLGLVTKNVDFERLDGEKANTFITKCLQNTIWTKDDNTWSPLVDAEGNAKLKELESNPSIALDLFYYFKRDVLAPVFTESKTFQNFIQESPQE